MYTEPALTPRSYQEILSRRPLEAIVYRENSETFRFQVNRIANSLLNRLCKHPCVAIHGNEWKERFSISSEDDSLAAIQKIYASFQNSRGKKDYPTLAFNSFEKLYRKDLLARENNFREQVYRAIHSSGDFSELSDLRERLTSSRAEPAPPALFIHRLALDLRKAGCEEILWSASAAANYWEAIPFLFKRQVPWNAEEGCGHPTIVKTEKNRDWIAAFNARSQVPIPFEPTKTLSLHQVVRQAQQEVRGRVSFFCERLSMDIFKWCCQDGQDAALWHIDRYAKEKIGEYVLAAELAECAAKYGWGNHLWRLSAATDYWEAIRILIQANIPAPLSDAEEPRSLLEIAEQSKSGEWIERFHFYTQEVR